MRFLNYARTHIKIYTFINYRREVAWKETPRINHNTSLDQHQAQGSVELMIFVNRPGAEGTLGSGTKLLLFDTRWGAKWGLSYLDPQLPNPTYPNTTTVVVTHHANQRVVDLGAVKKPYLDNLHAIGGNEKTNLETTDVGLQVGAAIINGLATGLAALGPIGALPGGGVMGLGNILLAVIGVQDGSPPKPPNASEITAIVATIVKREHDIDDAESAATGFGAGIEDLLDIGRDTFDLLVEARGTMTTALKGKINRLIDSNTENHGEGTLRYSIEHLQGHPEIAKWILPAYVDGIGAWLAFRRLDVLRTRLPDDGKSPPQITVSDVKKYLHELTSQRDALVAAYDAYEAHVDAKVKQAGLHETPLEKDLADLVTKSMFGTSDLSAIHGARGDLNVMIAQLEHDVDSGTTQNFWSATPAS